LLTRGTFLEIEAIPDIRAQCQRLATALLGPAFAGARTAEEPPGAQGQNILT